MRDHGTRCRRRSTIYLCISIQHAHTSLSLQQPQKIYLIGGRTLPPLKRSVWDAPFIFFACLRGDLLGGSRRGGHMRAAAVAKRVQPSRTWPSESRAQVCRRLPETTVARLARPPCCSLSSTHTPTHTSFSAYTRGPASREKC
jgi:hypothetical protein